MSTLWIGVDPGKKTGVAYWHDYAEKLEVLPAWPFWKAWHEVRATVRRAQKQGMSVCAVVEDPTQNAPVWSRGGQHGRKHIKIAQNVGSNKRDAQLWVSGLERLGIEVKKVRPEKSKWSRSTFENITGYEGRTSEHGRDAARLVFGL